MLFVLKTTFAVSGIGLDTYAIAQSHQFGNWSKGNYIPTFWVIRCNLLIVGAAATLTNWRETGIPARPAWTWSSFICHLWHIYHSLSSSGLNIPGRRWSDVFWSQKVPYQLSQKVHKNSKHHRNILETANVILKNNTLFLFVTV